MSVHLYVYSYLKYYLCQVLPLYLTCTSVCVPAHAHVPAEIFLYRYLLGISGAYLVLYMYLRTRVLNLLVCNL